MNRRSIRARLTRTVLAAFVGGSPLVLSGCDPTVRATLLTGFEATAQGLASALITATFQSLAGDAAAMNEDRTSPNWSVRCDERAD